MKLIHEPCFNAWHQKCKRGFENEERGNGLSGQEIFFKNSSNDLRKTL